MRTYVNAIAAAAILSLILLSPLTTAADGSEVTGDGTYDFAPSDAIETALQGTSIDTDELSKMLDGLVEKARGLADVKIPSLAQIVQLLKDVSKRGAGCLVIDGAYTFDKDVCLHRLYIRDGSDVSISPGVSVRADKLYIDTSGGTASLSTGEGASISFGDLFVERIPIPLSDVTVTTESTTFSSSCNLKDCILTLSMTASYDDCLRLHTKGGTVTYMDGSIDLSASLDFKRVLDPQFDLAAIITGSYSSADTDTPFHIEDLELRMGSIRNSGGNRDVDLSLSLGRVIAGPVDNKNMRIEMSFPLSSKDDTVHRFDLSAQSIHVEQESEGTSLLVDVRGLAISMWSGSMPGFFLSYDSLAYRSTVPDSGQVLEETYIEDVYIEFQGVYEKPVPDMNKGDRLVSVDGTIEVRSNDYYAYSPNSFVPAWALVKSSELEELEVQFVAGIPTDVRIVLASYEYRDDSGVEIAWSDIDYEFILFDDDPGNPN
jgi:hypothetical protein